MEEKVIYTILLAVTISFLGMLIGTLIGVMILIGYYQILCVLVVDSCLFWFLQI